MIVDSKLDLIKKKEIFFIFFAIFIGISIIAILVDFFLTVRLLSNSFSINTSSNNNYIYNQNNTDKDLKYGVMSNIDFRSSKNNDHNFKLYAKKMQTTDAGYTKFYFEDINFLYNKKETKYQLISKDSKLDIQKSIINFDNEITINVDNQPEFLIAKNGRLNFENLELISREVTIKEDNIVINSAQLKFDSLTNVLRIVGKSKIDFNTVDVRD